MFKDLNQISVGDEMEKFEEKYSGKKFDLFSQMNDLESIMRKRKFPMTRQDIKYEYNQTGMEWPRKEDIGNPLNTKK